MPSLPTGMVAAEDFIIGRFYRFLIWFHAASRADISRYQFIKKYIERNDNS
jgi:hypothetical protein